MSRNPGDDATAIACIEAPRSASTTCVPSRRHTSGRVVGCGRLRTGGQRMFRRRIHVRVVLASVLLSGTVLVAGARSASADGPGVGAPWVVSLGDSAISGEAGRWAGNTNDS